jgi:hypothetical protein
MMWPQTLPQQIAACLTGTGFVWLLITTSNFGGDPYKLARRNKLRILGWLSFILGGFMLAVTYGALKI